MLRRAAFKARASFRVRLYHISVRYRSIAIPISRSDAISVIVYVVCMSDLCTVYMCVCRIVGYTCYGRGHTTHRSCESQARGWGLACGQMCAAKCAVAWARSVGLVVEVRGRIVSCVVCALFRVRAVLAKDFHPLGFSSAGWRKVWNDKKKDEGARKRKRNPPKCGQKGGTTAKREQTPSALPGCHTAVPTHCGP